MTSIYRQKNICKASTLYCDKIMSDPISVGVRGLLGPHTLMGKCCKFLWKWLFLGLITSFFKNIGTNGKFAQNLGIYRKLWKNRNTGQPASRTCMLYSSLACQCWLPHFAHLPATYKLSSVHCMGKLLLSSGLWWKSKNYFKKNSRNKVRI